MGVAAPLFLAGLLAIALPVWLHRLQTKSSDRQPFSSAMLLESTEQRVHVQKKLKYLLLLAFRVLLLTLIALAFAQPFLPRDSAPVAVEGAGSDLVVVDLSASMGRSGVFEQALEAARRAIDDAEDGSTLQVLSAGAVVRELQPASTNRAAQRSALDGLEPGAARVDYGQLMSAVESYADSLPAPVRLHLVSDFQASGMPVQFADAVPAGVNRLIPYPVGTGEPTNWSIGQIREIADGVEVSLTASGLPGRGATVELLLAGQSLAIQDANGLGQHSLRFEGLEFSEGDNAVEIRLDTDDDLELDNRGYLVVRNDPPQPVPLVTRNPDGLPVTYLSAALESSADGAFSVQPMVPGQFDPRVLGRYDWIIVDDIGSVATVLAESLIEYVTNGGSLLGFAGDASRSLERLPVSNLALAAADLGSGVSAWRRVGSIDTRHAALADTDGWYQVRVSQNISVELEGDEQVPVRLDNGAPFIVELAIGSGRLLQVLSAADNSWNDLPVHPVFVGFMLEAADYLSGRLADFGSYSAGDSLALGTSGSGQVVDPDGESLLSLADTADAQSIRLEKPGIYTVYTANGETLVAANVDPRESDLQPLTDDFLSRWQEATFTETGDSSGRTAEGVAEPLALWPWLLLLLAVFVIAESALGNVHIATRMRASQ